MSRLDDLKYALASAGRSPEQIQATEQEILNMAVASSMSIEQVASDFLTAYYAIQSFSDGMSQIVTMAGRASVSIEALASATRSLLEAYEVADTPDTPPQPKPTERTPYYQKDKQQWWK